MKRKKMSEAELILRFLNTDESYRNYYKNSNVKSH